MPVPYGFGVGDLIAVGTLAWAIYKSCKEAPESFRNIHIEVLSLHALTKEAEETVFKAPLAPEREARLAVVKDGCIAVLTDLDKLVKNTSQVSVEQKLDKFLQEFKQGRREGSVISVQTIDSLTKDERVVWRTIRKELEDIETGAFEEDAALNSGDTTNAASPASKQLPTLPQLAASEAQPPVTGHHDLEKTKGVYAGVQFESRLILLEDTFMGYIAALHARSGSIGDCSSFAVFPSVHDNDDVRRLYNSMIRDPHGTELKDVVSLKVLFAAFVSFVSIAWKDKIGLLIEYDAWKSLKNGFESDSDNFAPNFRTFLGEIAPQNRRCLAATVNLFRQLWKASGNTSVPNNLATAFVTVLFPALQAPRRTLHVSILHRLADDYEALFEETDSEAARPDPSNVPAPETGIVSNRLRKRSDPRKQQPAGSGLPPLSAYSLIRAPTSSGPSLVDQPNDGENSAVKSDLASDTKRSTTDSISRTKLSSAFFTFSRRKKRFLAAAGDARGTSTIAKILAEYQFEKEVLGFALVKAAEAEAVRNMMLLIEAGADVDSLAEGRDKTPLSAAVYSMAEFAVDCLLAQGADVNCSSALVRPALHIAADKSYSSLITKLGSAGATFSAQGHSEDAAQLFFFNAMKGCSPEAIRSLIHAGAQVNSECSEMGTPLMYALRCCREDVVRVLIEDGADVCRRPSRETAKGCKCPMESAIVANIPSQVQLLLDHRAMATLDEANRLLEIAQDWERRYDGYLLNFHLEDHQNCKTIVDLIQHANETFSGTAS